MGIQILADEVVSKIAAGEVVERPASVVKELLENALDAEAERVTIRIEEAGRRLIQVSDDGHGISDLEIPLAVRQHATSKLYSAEDLFRIKTLGFRGEALSSIASISRFTLISRSRDAEMGGRLVVDGGQAGTVEKIGVPPGTVVKVEDLFFNVPARLKFLKTDSTEKRRIDALVMRYAIAYENVRLHLFHDGKPVLQTSGNGDCREVLSNLYGVEIARQMLEVVLEDAGIKIRGFISPVSLTRSNRREITFFVNGRWVQDSALAAAVLQAYKNLLMVGRYPLIVLFLEISPEEVDVNVHPTKAEVRFREQDVVFSVLQRAVKRALLAYSPVPEISSPAWQPGLPEAPKPDITWQLADEMRHSPEETARAEIVNAGEERLPQQEGLLKGQIPVLRLIGQIGAKYLVAEGPDGLYLIDQHAAHERVLFEKFLYRQSQQVPSQSLLEAVTFDLPPDGARLLKEQLPVLEKIGFDVEAFGPSTFRVRAIPAILTGSDPVSAVRVVVEDFEEDETPLQAEIEERIVARICKRVAVKGGQILSQAEQEALLQDLEACQSPRTCPHGRPTMIHLSVDLLERQFGRRGSR